MVRCRKVAMEELTDGSIEFGLPNLRSVWESSARPIWKDGGRRIRCFHLVRLPIVTNHTSANSISPAALAIIASAINRLEMAGQPVTVNTIQALLDMSEPPSAPGITRNDIALYFLHCNPVDAGERCLPNRAGVTCSPLPSGWIFDH